MTVIRQLRLMTMVSIVALLGLVLSASFARAQDQTETVENGATAGDPRGHL